VSAVGVIIPTYNGRERLPGALEALERQTFRDFEVVVSDDGSSDGTGEWLAQHAPHVRYRTGPNLGRAGARNAGARLSRAEMLVFLDDDMRPQPRCLQTLVERARNCDGLFTGAQWIPDLKLDDPEREECRAYRFALERRWKNVIPRRFTRMDAQNIFFTAAICLVPRLTFERLGGFEERLRDAEDLDFGLRALEAGIDVYYEPDAVAFHHDFPTLKRYVLRNIEYRKATARLLELRPHYAQKYSRFRTDAQKDTRKKFVYSLFSFPEVLDGLYAVRKVVPPGVRFRIYDRLIAGLSLYCPERMNFEWED
jgi:GT2 family glycosyltransferase